MLVREARKARGMTQQELAEALDVTGAAISAWENGKKPIPAGRYQDIANALHMDVAEIVAEKRYARPHEMEAWRQIVHEDDALSPWPQIVLLRISRKARTVDGKSAFIGGMHGAQLAVRALDEGEMKSIWPAVLESSYVEIDPDGDDDVLLFTFPTEH